MTPKQKEGGFFRQPLEHKRLISIHEDDIIHDETRTVHAGNYSSGELYGRKLDPTKRYEFRTIIAISEVEE